MPAVIVALILIESLLLLISNLVRIPECASIVIGILLVVAVWFLWRSKKNTVTKKTLTVLSLFAICWSLYSAYALPYWNSISYLDLMGVEYPVSRGLDEVLSPEEAKQDYLFAVKQLKKVHPVFLEDAESTRQIITTEPLIEWIDSVSVCQLYQRLQTTVSSLRDAHTKVFPVSREHRRADYSTYGTVISINHIRREDFYDSLGCFISSETRDWTEYRINSALNDIECLKLFGLFDNDSVSVVFDSPENGRTRHTFRSSDYQQKGQVSSNSLAVDYNGGYGFDDTAGCGYLRLDNMLNYSLAARTRFNNGLKELFLRMSMKNYRYLIIDLRGNPGGNVEIARELFRYLPIDEVKMGARYRRRGPAIFGGPVSHPNRKRKDLCFEGDVYVLTSISTFSAAMHLADYLQGNGLAKIVGESPGNTPTCYTNVAHFVLPNSRLSLNVSTEKFIRTDETQEENVIIPDLPCKAGSAYQALMDSLLYENNDEL